MESSELSLEALVQALNEQITGTNDLLLQGSDGNEAVVLVHENGDTEYFVAASPVDQMLAELQNAPQEAAVGGAFAAPVLQAAHMIRGAERLFSAIGSALANAS